MRKDRLEAFSDGVIAILITIMVLGLRSPSGSSLSSLFHLYPLFLTYVMSFVYLAIYWNNHHHLLQATHKINGTILWANMHLLFWLSLIPFVTSWMGEQHFAPIPTAAYGVILFLASIAYHILQACLVKEDGPDSHLAHALGRDLKGKISPVLYLVAIIASAGFHWVSECIYAIVALMWLIPDRRIESNLKGHQH